MNPMALDHEERRTEIAAVTVDIIAREGLAAATIRRIAAEAGSSTTPISHLFDDKTELLVHAYEVLSREGERRFEAELRADPSDAIGALLTMVPWCSDNVRRWKAYLAFWDEAARNPELAGLLGQSTRAGTELLRRLLTNAGVADMNLDKAGELLSAIVQGLALQMLVNRSSWPIEKIRSTLGDSLQVVLLQAGKLSKGSD